jgi:hypothetical protein
VFARSLAALALAALTAFAQVAKDPVAPLPSPGAPAIAPPRILSSTDARQEPESLATCLTLVPRG